MLGYISSHSIEIVLLAGVRATEIFVTSRQFADYYLLCIVESYYELIVVTQQQDRISQC